MIEDLNVEEIVGTFYKKKYCKKQINKSLEMKKYSREKVINYLLNGKVIIILTVGLIKKDIYSKYFPKPKYLGGNMKVELDLPCNKI